MKIEKAMEQFKGSDRVFQCPICKSRLSLMENSSFVCKQNHCFDLSSKGYINFIPNQNQKKIKYSKDLFVSRKAVFDGGFYKPILSSLADMIRRFHPNETSFTLLDAGCGEGYYSLQLEKDESFQLDLYAMDNSREAVQLATHESRTIQWMIADLSEIPMKDRSIDVLLNILTPANYQEFLRVLSPQGILIKIVPGSNYLKEIRACVCAQLRHKTYSNEKVTDYFHENIRVLKQKTVTYQMPVNAEQLRAFLHMTPMTFGVDLDAIDCSHITHITIDLDILVGTHPGKA